jgi:vancomycin permeability regulator SanA
LLGRKKRDETPIPAIERYKSIRIQTVFSLAKEQGIKFLILSGDYGLLEAKDKIDFYDHLLLEHEVEKKALFVSAQLKEKKFLKLSSIQTQ